VEIVLLVAILAVAGSALYVAFTFKNHVTRNPELARKADLELLVGKTASDISGQAHAADADLHRRLQAAADDQSKQFSALRAELNDRLEKLDRQVSRLGTALAFQRELMSGSENDARRQETQEDEPREMGALEPLLLQAEAYVAGGGWGQPPRLFALSRKSSLVTEDSGLAARLEDATPDELILVLQEDLPADEPFDAIARIRWPDEVAGCVLVTEIVALPPEAEKDMPGLPAERERWASELSAGQTARLAVGVSRAGGYLCGLRLVGEDNVQVAGDLADDLVAALLGTF
jgi:hypothetical protein